jgi:UDP-2,3-diacylglucosamine pyrophosphatase LpxH
MKWSEIRKQYPDKFVLIGDIVETKISKTKSKILEGNILEISDDGKEIFNAYRKYKKKGTNVLFSLPTTPSEFIVEDVAIKGILK